METVNIHKAKTNLSKLVDEAAKGKPFIIAKAGKPMVKVVPLDAPEPKKKQRLGFLKKEQVSIPDDFDTLYADEIVKLFENDGKL